MADSSTHGQPAAAQTSKTGRGCASLVSGGLVLIALLLSGCSVDAQHRRPGPASFAGTASYDPAAQDLPPPGSIYAGWRLFQHRCAGCHGAAATGTAKGPNLLSRNRELDRRKFITDVLYRYDWGIPAARSNQDAIDALIEEVQNRGPRGQVTVPFWQGEPQITANIVDLHDYLGARANGTAGPWRPPR